MVVSALSFLERVLGPGRVAGSAGHTAEAITLH